MTWLYKNTQIENLPEDCIGFVYLITNNLTGRKYIGKKLAKFSKTTYKTVTQKNGTKKRKKIRSKIDSDWREYYGSSPELTADVIKLGTENFTREILYYCKSKSECLTLRPENSLQGEYWNQQIITTAIYKYVYMAPISKIKFKQLRPAQANYVCPRPGSRIAGTEDSPR